jgi:arabinogalactan oligomer / maltooligosaccharide transport system substrate-binding protein
MKKKLWFWFVILMAIVSITSGCKQTPSPTALPTQLFPAATQETTQTNTPTLPPSREPPSATPTPVQLSPSPTSPVPAFEDTPTPQAPSREDTPTPSGAYPGPEDQPGVDPYPAAPDEPGVNPYPAPQEGEEKNFTQTPTPTSGPVLSPTSISPTPVSGLTATERVAQPFGLDVTPSAGKISIYHSWTGSKFEALMQIIQSFQESYPDITFDLTYIPQSDLLERYSQVAYNGAGPELLLGSSDWRAALSRQELAEDLTPYISASFREIFNPVALETGQYKELQACLPYDLRGVLLYRNKLLIPEAPKSFEQLVTLAEQVKGVGTLGAYFEGGSYFSLGNLAGLGGELLDSDANPLFDRNQYQAALAWMNLLKAMKQTGALEMNGDKDLQLFKDGKSGFLVEGSWNKDELAQAIGAKNLVIDRWPTYQDGHLSGYIQSDCVYLNANTRELSALDHQAALKFMGYFLTSPMQDRLAEAGIIPALVNAQPSDPLTRQAMLAFEGGTVYPAEFDDTIRQVYFTALDGAAAEVVHQGMDPKAALKTAFEAIQKRLSEIRAGSQ